MDIILQDKRKFNVEGYLHEQGKALVGTTPKHWANMFLDRGKINLRIKDMETEEEQEFDVGGFLEEQGVPIDYGATFRQQQEQAKKQRKQARVEETFKEEAELRKLQKEEGSGRALSKTLFPFQWRRQQNVIAGKDEESTMKDVWAASLDFFSMLPRQAVGLAEAGLYKMSEGEYGRPLTVSMGRMADYGADVDPETGEEETLSTHMKTLQDAMRVDPKGVMADLAIESARDPLSGAHAAVTIATMGGSTPISAFTGGARVAAMLGRVARKYKTVSSNVVATSKFIKKTHDKLTKGGIAKRAASKIVGEGIEGGVQGVFTNYALGENKNAWNSFVIEGVEEAIFGGMMFIGVGGTQTALSKAWSSLSKTEKKNALFNVGDRARLLREQGIEPTPELLFGDVNTNTPPAGAVDTSPQTKAQELLKREQEAQMQTDVTQALPPGVPRKDMIKKILNPLHESPVEQQVRIELDETERQVKKDLGKIKTVQQQAIDEARGEAEKVISDVQEEIEQEDVKEDAERQKNLDETAKTLSAVIDPTKETPFDTWDKVFGTGMTVEEKINAFEEFRVNEQKGIDAVKERISPTEKEEVQTEEPVLPAMIEEPAEVEIPPVLRMKKGDVDPWATTKADYLTEHPGKAGEMAHRGIVQKAISAGKEVPPEVLADYPDIEPASFDIGRKDGLQAELKTDITELLSPEKFKAEFEQFGPLGETVGELQEDIDFAKEMEKEAKTDNEKASAQERLQQAEAALKSKREAEVAGFEKPAKAAPKKTKRAEKEKPKKARNKIGQNKYGQEVYEDEKGVRSYNEGGILVGETVSLTPTRAGVETTVAEARGDEFKTMAETEQEPADAEKKFINIVDESKADEIIKRLQGRLRPGRLYSNPMFDPELWTDLVELGMIRAQQGINSFVEWSDRIVQDLGREVKPFLQSAYNALQAYPRNVKFNPKIAVKLFEFGGITRQEQGSDRASIEQALTENFGPDAAKFTDFIHEGLEQYPSIQQVQELAYESPQAEVEDVTPGIPEPADPGAGPVAEGEPVSGERPEVEGVEPGAENRPDIRPIDADVAGEPSPYGLDHGESEGETDTEPQKEIAKDVYVRQNMDLRSLPSVEMTPAKRRELNLQAAEILERVKKDPASLTQDDRLILRQYTGQGGLDIAKLETKELAGTLNQHYTSYQVAKATWDIIEAMGFNLRGIEALEPTAGVGNFAGMAPRGVRWRLNEVDETAGEIMNLLYPEAENSVAPFETYVGPQKDIVISNVPFLEHRGKFGAREDNPKYQSIKSLHNYVMMKSIDQLRDNGLGVFITSTWTMDGKNPEFRKQLNQKAAVLAAIRIPMGAFQKNTQYAGSADLIILRKRTAAEMENTSAEERIQPEFVNSVAVQAKQFDGTFLPTTRAGWFEVHRSQAIGEWKYGTSKGGQASSTALDVDKALFEAALGEHFNRLKEELAGKYVPEAGAMLPADMIGVGEDLGAASDATPKFGLEIKDGVITRVDQVGRLRRLRPETFKVKRRGVWVDEADWSKKGIGDKHLTVIIRLMETAKALRDGVAEGIDVKHLQDRAKRLLSDYQSLPKHRMQKVIKRDGKEIKLYPGVSEKKVVVETDTGKKIQKTVGLQFHHNALMAYTGLDNRYWLLRTLYNKELNGFSSLLTEKPVVKVAPEPKKGNMKTAEGVVDYVMEKYGVFRTADALEAYDGTADEFKAEMMAHPKLNWNGEEFIHDQDYIVGNLREKIEYAEKMNLKRQVEKLRAALPEQATAQSVDVGPTATWWDYDALTAFGHHAKILGQGQRIERVREGLKTKFRIMMRKYGELEIFDVNDRTDPLYQFVEVVLNQRNAMMPDPFDKSEKPRMINDFKETERLRKEFGEKFEQWARTPNNEHTVRAATNYNENFASRAVDDYSSEAMFIKGISPTMNGKPFTPFAPQLSAVRMFRNQHGGILAHDVGNGKTLAAIFCFADALQSGKSKKCVVNCPASTVGMWEENFLQAMPGVKVKVIHGKGDIRRSDFMDAVANDYEVVIIAHNTMKTIPLRKSNVYIEEDIAQMREILQELIAKEEATGGWSKRKVASQRKAVEKRMQNLQKRMELNQKAERDMLGGVFYEDLGSDMLIVDEAHNHKNTFEHTNEYAEKQFLKLGKKSSHMADDLQHKSRYIHEINNRGGVLMLTATPTPNSIIEIYSMIKFVAPWEWEQRGIKTVDDFIRNFVDLGPLNQATLTGTSADKEGVLGYKNGKALNDVVRTWADYKAATPEEQIGRPETEEETIIIEPNDEQLNMMGEIAVLSAMSYKELLGMGINPVTLTTRAKALAMDPAFENPAIVEEYPSFYTRSPKMKAVMDGVRKNFEARPDRVQAIFMEQYRVQDWRPMTDAGGNKITWPAGFGLVTDESGEMVPAGWMKDLLPGHDTTIVNLMKQRPNPNEWDARFLDKNGIPKTFTSDMLEKIKPLFNDETGEIFIQERYVKQDLHQEMRKYAINEIGMDPDRVYIVNGISNNKPEDKTRIETINYLEKMSLLIGNAVMSEGLNLQTKGDAIFDVDIPWEPKTLTQRHGRMLRPRHDLNDKTPVKIQKYAMRYSADRRLWEILERKEDFNRQLNYTNWDNIDNSINNVKEVGLSDLSEQLRVPQHIVEGFKMKYAVAQDGLRLKTARKEARKKRVAVERAKENFAEATRKVEDAQEKINKGMEKHQQKTKETIEYNQSHPDKPRELPPPYDPAHWQEVIRRNTPGMEAGQKFIDEALEAYKPYEKIELDYELNQLAQSMLRDVHKNNWASLESSLKSNEDVSTYRAFLEKAYGGLYNAYPSLADMMTAKILTTVPKDPAVAFEQVRDYLVKNHYTTGQEGFSTLGTMMVIAGTPLALMFPKTTAAVAGGALMFYAFRRAWRSKTAKEAGWSLWARLREMPGFTNLEPLINQAMTQQQNRVAREEDEFKRAIKGLNQDELLRIPDKIEDDSIQETPAVTEAAKKLQRLFLRVALEAQKAGINIPTDINYYPRMLDFAMIQKMKGDQTLLDKNAVHLVESGQVESILDAYGILLNFFDNSSEMRGERRRAETAKIMQGILERNPTINPQTFMTIFQRMKQKYGLQIVGNLKYGRVAPKLLNEMYHRDPREVMAKYLPGAWNTIIQRNILGEGNNNAINQFLNGNYPVTDQVNPERDEVALWFKKQLEGGSFAGSMPMRVSKAARSYQFWTKLVTSHLAPAKNIAGAFNLALPLAGGRATAVGLVKGLSDVRSGFRPARVAGAISNRMIAEIYGMGEKIEKTSFQKLARAVKEWNLFGISEKFVRSFGFHAGRNMADRLFYNATEKNNNQDYQKLHEVLGQGRMTKALLEGKLSPEDLDLFGVFMSNKIGGTTNPFDLARWMNTPEGRLIMQFHSMAMTQTRTFKDEILMPAFRKKNRDVMPLVRWGMAVGMTLPAIIALQAGIYNLFGEDPPEQEDPDNPLHWAWNAAMMSNMVFALGMYGDIAAGLDTPEGVTPLIGTMAGPTISTILNSTRDFGYFVGGDEGRLKRIARREVPGLNFLTKMGVTPGLEPD